MSTVQFQCKPFAELTLTQWYAISQAREQVFIIEQNCPYLDSDGRDLTAWQIRGFDKVTDRLACHARLLPPAIHITTGQFANLKMPSIGRVLTVADYRRQGLASELMRFAIAQTHKIYPDLPIFISAQVYLLDFYQRLGFVSQGEGYLEDGIPHQGMVLSNS